MKAQHSKQVLVGLSVFSDGVLLFLQIKKKLDYLFYRNYLSQRQFCFKFDLLYIITLKIGIKDTS